ncbi:MAG: hypothetical protein A2Y89_04805 [Chloroflexi bacterium RBG_13_51_18]|nr:MAG: hypothetical protein A2Y89_04805 [Chloroflexi bacterium RBG_13_51_18]
MMKSRYEKYVTRKAEVILGPGPDGAIKFGIPKTYKLPLTDKTTTGPRLIFSNDNVKEATSKIEYGWVIGDMTLLTSDKDYGAHKHDYPEIFIFFGNDPYDTSYLGGDGEFWLGEGNSLEKIKFDESCSIYVPAGLGHFPLFFRNVKSPIMMGVVVPEVGDFKLTPVPRS